MPDVSWEEYDRLKEIAQRVAAATEGPWHGPHDEYGCVHIGDYGWVASGGERMPAYDEDSDQGRADAEMIAHARTDIPAMHAALTAVLALHRPESDGPYSLLPDWAFCSCGAMEPFADDDGYASLRPARYPCATVRAINDALGGE
jgi:hypothetical protein